MSSSFGFPVNPQTQQKNKKAPKLVRFCEAVWGADEYDAVHGQADNGSVAGNDCDAEQGLHRPDEPSGGGGRGGRPSSRPHASNWRCQQEWD